MTSPSRPGVPAGAFWSLWVESATPETKTRGLTGSIAMPPEAPGMGIVWMTLPVRTETMRTSLAPRPEETVQKKRPFGVSRPPVGNWPIVESFPYGRRKRPLLSSAFSGPMRPWSTPTWATASPTPARAGRARRTRRRRRKAPEVCRLLLRAAALGCGVAPQRGRLGDALFAAEQRAPDAHGGETVGAGGEQTGAGRLHVLVVARVADGFEHVLQRQARGRGRLGQDLGVVEV